MLMCSDDVSFPSEILATGFQTCSRSSGQSCCALHEPPTRKGADQRRKHRQLAIPSLPKDLQCGHGGCQQGLWHKPLMGGLQGVTLGWHCKPKAILASQTTLHVATMFSPRTGCFIDTEDRMCKFGTDTSVLLSTWPLNR